MANAEDKSDTPDSPPFVANRDAEPQVICHDLLHRLIREQGYKGEAGRLCRDEEIKLQNITVLKIEFQNILLIDHLWKLSSLQKLSLKCNKIDKIENLDLLTNLRELDLSFNFIERIENLECLTKLEFLSLFGNQITQLQNLDALVNLVRLSLGNNQIKTLKNIVRLRFMHKLYSFNMKGNPVVTNFRRDVKFTAYLAAVLPNLKYYNYELLTDADREEGRAKFRSELRAIEEAETDEIEQRVCAVRNADEETRLSTCFVEFLDGHQLFDSLFIGDNNANILLIVDGTDEPMKAYRDQVFQSTQKILNLGIEKYESRVQNIAEFNEAIEDCVKQVQMEGIGLIDQFVAAEQANKQKIEELYVQLSNADSSPDDNANLSIEKINKDIYALNDEYTLMLDEAWYALMDLEMTLHERIDEANASFAHTIQDMLFEFVENAQLYFVEITEAEGEFSDRLHELISACLNRESASEELHLELRKCRVDKEKLANLIATSREFRLQVIDRREERLVARSRAWVTKLMEDSNQIERGRNRAKLVEVHNFIEEHRTFYANFMENIAYS